MTKLNHDRPALRLLDNYRREIRNQPGAAEAALRMATQKPVANPMPPVSEVARALILSIFDAATLYFDSFSAWLETMSPTSGKALRRKGPALKAQLDHAKDQLIVACAALVLEAVRESSRKEKGVVSWLAWLQKESKRKKSSVLCDVIEIGFKPAFEKLEAAIGTN